MFCALWQITHIRKELQMIILNPNNYFTLMKPEDADDLVKQLKQEDPHCQCEARHGLNNDGWSYVVVYDADGQELKL